VLEDWAISNGDGLILAYLLINSLLQLLKSKSITFTMNGGADSSQETNTRD